jgi:hypothetical protein
LEWFENFRLRYELAAGREAARIFWRGEVIGKERRREAWQLSQWEDAIKWYMKWLEVCVEQGGDLERRQITIRQGKGDLDRVTVRPEALVAARRLHEADREAGHPGVAIPGALGKIDLLIPP